MIKLTKLLVLLLCFVINTNAQTVKVITGKITDPGGSPIPGASILLKGTNKGASASEEGTFKISVPIGSTLVFTAINYDPVEKVVGESSSISVVMQLSVHKEDEVIVTALGVKRSKNLLPYAAQTIGGDEVANVRTGNAIAALSGKASGIEIRQNNNLGGATNVVIRGIKSLSNTNQALFVIDGVPIDNTSQNSSNQQRGAGGYDYGNPGSDINPDDIASMTILKGAAATALYGSRAANGVIVINTKGGRRGTNVTVNAGLRMAKIDKKTFIKYQNEYGAGYSSEYQKDGFLYFDANGDGIKDLVAPTSEDASYGAKYDPSLMVYQWDAFGDPTSPYYKTARPWVAAKNDPSKFYETAWSYNTSVFVDGANDKGAYKIGYTRNDDKGTLPNSQIVKNNINFSASYEIAKGLKVTGNANYSVEKGLGRYGTGYSGGNLNQNFRQWYQTNVDVLEQKDAYFRTGKNMTWNWKDPSTDAGLVPIYTNNYYWTRYMNYESDSRNRLIGNVSLTYQATDWLSFMARATVDNYSTLQEERVAVGSQGVSSYNRSNINFNENNYDLMANIDKDLTQDLNLKGLIGLSQRRTRFQSIYAASSGGLVIPLLYTVGNSAGTISAPTERNEPIAVDGYYGSATLTYKRFLSLDGSFRRDRFSTLPENKNAFNYGGLSLSYIFSEHLKNIPWITFGKLRLNYAEAGNGPTFGATQFYYDVNQTFGSSLMYSMPAVMTNETLKPEKTKSKEIGLEMSFLRGRLGFDATYYYTNSLDQNIPMAVSTATGFDSKYVNAGNVRNSGIEIILNGTPVKTANFSWNVKVNFTANRNKVLDLVEGADNILLASSQGGITINATKGQPFGTIQGKKVIQHNGKDSIGANGYYAVTSSTNNVLGNYNPKWVGGIYNTFNYKDFTLGFLVDVRKGGSVFSLDQYYGHMTGVAKESAGLNDLGNPQRDPVTNDPSTSGGIILDGVVADGSQNTQRVTIDANSPAFPVSKFVYDAGYIKLREAVLSYNLPFSLINKIKGVKGIQFSLIGRNLWLIHKNVPYADPEESLGASNVQGIQSGAYPTERSFMLNAKINF